MEIIPPRPWPRSQMRDYQQAYVPHVVNNLESGLFLQMASGKTAIALFAVLELFQRGEVQRVLVIAPPGVAEKGWIDERDSWIDLKPLVISTMTGSPKEREQALRRPAHIYTLSIDLIPWLVNMFTGKKWPFDMVIFDEISMAKSHESNRFKFLELVRAQIKRFVGMTGTPVSDSYLDLWAPMKLIDRGVRLGYKFEDYKRFYFYKNANGFGHTVVEQYKQVIADLIKDICVSMKTRDHIDLPPVHVIDIPVEMPAEVAQRYKEFQREKVLEYLTGKMLGLEHFKPGDDPEYIKAKNKGVLVGKLLQFANGAVWKNPMEEMLEREWLEVHQAKINALRAVLDHHKGTPVLCFFQFVHDRDRIAHYLKDYNPRFWHSAKRDVDDWNAGKIPFFCANPKSMSHGLNLQFGGHIEFWFGLPWSNQTYEQAGFRLLRPGQQHEIYRYRALTVGTMDKAVADKLEGKAGAQEYLMDAVKLMIADATRGSVLQYI